MKEIITNLALFVVFCVVFSGLTACTGTQSNAVNGNAVKPPAPSGKTSIYPLLASGLAEADFELLDGGTMKISSRRGKVLLLNIWATWCGPCRDEMPHLVALQQQYGSRGFEVLGLNIGGHDGNPEGIELIKKFAADMKLNYTLARSPPAATGQFYAVTKQQVVPQTILVDREGHMRGVFIGSGPRVVDPLKQSVEKTMSE